MKSVEGIFLANFSPMNKDDVDQDIIFNTLP